MSIFFNKRARRRARALVEVSRKPITKEELNINPSDVKKMVDEEALMSEFPNNNLDDIISEIELPDEEQHSLKK